jgi:DNA-binding MarR family transcriptional regulator
MADDPRDEDVPVVQLMREARDLYREAIRQRLESAGSDDLPRNATLVLASLGHESSDRVFSPQADVVARLGLSKQMASQLIDTLVVRNYLERRSDPLDRRRMEVRLTARGRTAASVIQGAVDAVETEVASLISPKELAGLRTGLAAYRRVHKQRRHETELQRARSFDGEC